MCAEPTSEETQLTEDIHQSCVYDIKKWNPPDGPSARDWLYQSNVDPVKTAWHQPVWVLVVVARDTSRTNPQTAGMDLSPRKRPAGDTVCVPDKHLCVRGPWLPFSVPSYPAPNISEYAHVLFLEEWRERGRILHFATRELR